MAAVGGLAAPTMLLAQRRRDTYTDPGEMERAMRRTRPIGDRFWSKVNKNGPVHPTLGTECWVWERAVHVTTGYGWFCGEKALGTNWAHRVAWMLSRGPIPKCMTIDHLCGNKLCVNPGHLEVVTLRVNILRGNGCFAINARKTHCVRGHELAGANLRMNGSWRTCRACARDRSREKRKQRKLSPKPISVPS